MTLAEEDRQFERWRRTNDSEALARVFDLTAPRLLLIALHVCRSSSRAEDLVQTTFLEAMRDSAAWDSKLPVYRWLAGILNHRALDEFRRRRVRSAEDIQSLELPNERQPGPLQEALESELTESIATKVDALPAPYREVLILRLVHGLEPVDIAHSLQRSPSTVRMQLKRGLERLRRELPESLALPALFGVDAGRGLAGVKASVLGEASALAGAAGGWTSIWSLTLMQLKTMWAVGGVGLVVAAALWMNRDTAAPNPRAADEVAHATPLGHPRSTPATDPQRAQLGTTGAQAARVSERRSTVLSDPTLPTTLRVAVRIDGTGAPASGVGIHLGRADGPVPGLERTTDASGEVLFSDLAPGLFRVTPDRGDALETQVRGGQDNEVLVELPAGLRVLGEVVDLTGQVVPEARIYRRQEAHPNFLQAIATADGDGRFVIENVPERSTFLARAPGHQPSTEEAVRQAEDGTHRLALVLGARGHRLKGVVLGANGDPAGPVLVAVAVDEDARRNVAGITPEQLGDPRYAETDVLDRETIFVRADAEGRFELDEVPAGPVSLMTRGLGADQALVATGRVDVWPTTRNRAVLQLAAGAELSGRVADESGRPFPYFSVRTTWDGSREFGSLEDDLGPLLGDRGTLTDANGDYRLVGLLPGEHDLYVRPQPGGPTLANGERLVEAGEHAHWNPVLPVRPELNVRLEGPAGEPLSAWGVRAVPARASSSDFEAGLSRTAADGRCAVKFLSNAPHQLWIHAPPSSPSTSTPIDTLPCRVLEGIVGAPGELVVRLSASEMPSATVTGRLLAADGSRLEGARLSFSRTDIDLDHRASRVETDFRSEGRFEVSGLLPGSYEITGSARRSNREPLRTLVLRRGDRIDLGTLRLSDPTTLVVQLRAEDGSELRRPVVILRAGARGEGAMRFLSQTEDRGRDEWERDSLVPGPYQLTVYAEESAPLVRTIEVGGGGEQVERFVCARGSTRQLVVALDRSADSVEAPAPSGRVDLTVRDAAGVQILFESALVEAGARADVVFDLRLEAGAYTGTVNDRRRPGSLDIEVPFEIGPRAPHGPIDVSLP